MSQLPPVRRPPASQRSADWSSHSFDTSWRSMSSEGNWARTLDLYSSLSSPSLDFQRSSVLTVIAPSMMSRFWTMLGCSRTVIFRDSGSRRDGAGVWVCPLPWWGAHNRRFGGLLVLVWRALVLGIAEGNHF